MEKATILDWILKLIPAFIFLQTLFFKFTGAPESIYIFETLGMGTPGRIGTGIVELIAAVLILIPRTTGLGALIGLGTVAGAILGHIFVLGIEVQGDGGFLFGLAVVTLICCAILVWKNRTDIPILNKILS